MQISLQLRINLQSRMPPDVARVGKFRGAAIVALLVTSFPTAVRAEETAVDTDTLDASFTLSAVSDYRYRGLSLSNKKPALQAEFSVSHDSGVYTRFWGSTIADNGGADIETQVTVGYYAELGAFNADAQAAYYIYPGAAGDNYGEVALRLGRSVGPAELGATVSYAPRQRHIGDTDNLYTGLDASVPLFGELLTLSGNFGVEDGAFGDRKLDWSVGVSGQADRFLLGLAYVDTSRTFGDRLGEPSVVASISATF
ncbi:TorF family putative porin [Sphingopyxis panaciterrae]